MSGVAFMRGSTVFPYLPPSARALNLNLSEYRGNIESIYGKKISKNQ